MNEIYSQYALPRRTMVQEYQIVGTLGVGTFGIVYCAKNKYFSELVAIKEFLPSILAFRQEGEHRVRPLSSETEKVFKWSRKKFLQEAKNLRELGNPSQHPNIVRVIQFIEANDTAYMVMDFEAGKPLKQVIKERGPLEEKEIKGIRDALLDGLERVHEAAILHRDIKPTNILIRPDGSPVLIDFGAARKEIAGTDQSTMAVYSPAFAAPEQIQPIVDQGPWTDIYSLGATLYVAVTGKLPEKATARMQKKRHVSAAEAAKEHYSKSFLAGIDAALKLNPKNRPQSIAEWKILFEEKTNVTHNETIQLSQPKKVPQKESSRFRSLIAIFSVITVVMTGLLIARIASDRPAFTNQEPSSTVNETVDEAPAHRGVPELGLSNESKSKNMMPSVVQANLKINSVPKAAKVFLNDEFKGTTPLETTVSEGTYALRISLEDHYDWESTLLIEEEGEIPIRIPLLYR